MSFSAYNLESAGPSSVFHRPNFGSPIPEKQDQKPNAEIDQRINQLERENALLKQKLNEEKAKNLAYASQTSITNLSESLAECEKLVTHWFDNPYQDTLELCNSQDPRFFELADKVTEIYQTCLPHVKADVEVFSGFINRWNHVQLRLYSIDKIKNFFIDSQGFPLTIQSLLEEIETSKKTLEPLSNKNFLSLKKEEFLNLKEIYQSTKDTFEKIEKRIEGIENDPKLPIFLKNLFDIINKKNEVRSNLVVLQLSEYCSSVKLVRLDSLPVRQDFLSENCALTRNEMLRYQELFDRTCSNWFELIREIILLKRTWISLEKIIKLEIPIRRLQAETVNLGSLAKTVIKSSRKTTEETGRSDLDNLNKKREEFKSMFTTCLKNKISIEEKWNKVTEKLDTAHAQLFVRLSKQTSLLNEVAFDIGTTKIKSLQEDLNQNQIVSSNDLTSAWTEIERKLLEVATYLDKIDYGIYYSGRIPRNQWFLPVYQIYSGEFYRQLNGLQSAPNKALPLPKSEGADIDGIPVLQLDMDCKIVFDASKTSNPHDEDLYM